MRNTSPEIMVTENNKMKKHKHRFSKHGCHCRHGIMSVEEEVEMLEKAKKHLEAQLTNVNERLSKLKE